MFVVSLALVWPGLKPNHVDEILLYDFGDQNKWLSIETFDPPVFVLLFAVVSCFFLAFFWILGLELRNPEEESVLVKGGKHKALLLLRKVTTFHSIVFSSYGLRQAQDIVRSYYS